jgi:hypothetical protein
MLSYYHPAPELTINFPDIQKIRENRSDPLRASRSNAFCGMIRFLITAAAAAFLASCSSLPIPSAATANASSQEARHIMERSAAVTGNPWKRYREIQVEYNGDWAPLAVRLQPVLTDSGFRKSSVETYKPSTRSVRQIHTGPKGIKMVERRGPDTRIAFNGVASDEREILDAAALVADAYTAFLFGPSWLESRGAAFRLLGEQELGGETCQLIAGRLSPGFGASGEDHFIAWIGRESSLMRRFQFTLNGLDSTRGADVDVTFSDFHKAPDGSLWPGHFLERIQRPILAKAHEWRMTSLRLDGLRVKFSVLP